jgi:hypothetical protein
MSTSNEKPTVLLPAVPAKSHTFSDLTCTSPLVRIAQEYGCQYNFFLNCEN